ncbi:MAG: hypothetical protein OEV00_05860 [Acidobacteriota bacterium]|nr:hypothetical protein [Acidobacteriota bacterium]MDH3784839.1 hypothetical protein [Acidobacteriota bacterium]
MNRTWTLLLVITFAVFALVSCSAPESDNGYADTTPAEETNPDPTVVDAGHYKIEFENDRVRLVRISYGPGEESVMHYHPDSVAVFLTDSLVEMGLPDGSSEELAQQTGQHMFSPAGQHLPRNIGDSPMELMLVELKSGSATATAEMGPDPTVVDSDHYTLEFENESVRVIRIAYGPGEESVMHYHPDNVAVFLTDIHSEMGAADGSSEEMQSHAGQHGFAAADQHLPKNIGDEPFELVLVELK